MILIVSNSTDITLFTDVKMFGKQVSPLSFIISPVPKDRGMLWFYVKAARHPPPTTRRPPPAMVLTR